MTINFPTVVSSGAALNLATFAGSSKFIFDGTYSSGKTVAFASGYLSAATVALSGAFRKPTECVLRQAGAAGAIATSSLIFLAAVKATRSQPLTYILSPDSPVHLNKDGPYRYIRHPFYASYIGTFAALALASDSPAPLLAFATVASFYTYQTLCEEEKFANSSLSSAYNDYAKEAGRFSPRAATIWQDVNKFF